MKNIFLTSAIIAIMSYPAIALDANNHIEPSPTNDCVESTLGTATGPANLEADWTANTINLEWYNEDTKLTVPTTSNTCTYDGGITLPSTNPEKTGYTFKGWAVRETIQQCSLSGLDTSINGTDYGYQNDSTGQYGASSSNTTKYGITQDQTWATEFSYGTVKGVALCSTTNGTYATAGTPDESGTGQYCWCKATGLAEPNSTEYCPVASSSWVFRSAYGNAGSCANLCASDCPHFVRYFSDFRPAVFGQ